MKTTQQNVPSNPLRNPLVERDLRRLTPEEASYLIHLLSEPDDWDEFEECEYEPDGEEE